LKKKKPTRKPETKKAPKSKRRGGPALLFVVDPWETLDHIQDTTLRLVEEAVLAGSRVAIAENRSIGLDRGVPYAEIREVTSVERPRTAENVRRGEPRWTAINEFDHVFYRTDPPVDLAYLLPLQILAAARGAGKKEPKIHSSPESLFFLNEKWGAFELGALFPRSLVSASIDRLGIFAAEVGKAVLKPLYLAQSKGVEVIDARSLGAGTIRDRFRLATEGGRLPVIVQEFLPGIAKGETRLWFADGKLLASVKKVPRAGESIIDMDQGGKLAAVKLSVREIAAAKKIGTFLKRHTILFAAVDLIDGKITDFNHTSPGLLVAMETLLGKNLARPALRSILKR
jgi:glutathione synthase